MAGEFNIMAEKGTTESDGCSFSRFDHAVIGTFYLLFCVIGVGSNFLTALTFYKDTRLLPTSKPWLHILLALANIIVVAPSFLPASSSFTGKWLYGNTMCQLYAFEGMFVGIAAITTVIALCVERYCVARKALGADKSSWFHTWSAILIVGNALFWATMPLLGWSRYAVELTGTSCALDWYNPDDGYVSYLVSLEILSFGIPVAVGLICVCSADPRTPEHVEPRETAQASEVIDQTQAGLSEDQLKKLCYVFLLFLLVGWGPFAFLCTYTMLLGSQGMSMLGATLPPLACKLMVSAYPLTYAIASPRFRASMAGLFGGQEQRKAD